jgi:hypothetical protein
MIDPYDPPHPDGPVDDPYDYPGPPFTLVPWVADPDEYTDDHLDDETAIESGGPHP